jgi:two-component system LytT family response regulator
MKTLIIDDEPQCQEVLELLIRENHPELTLAGKAGNVAEGLAMIRQHSPELVFLDVEMPDGTGFDLVSSFPEVPFNVVFVTAHNDYAVSAFRLGALDFIHKPVTANTLQEAVERVMQKQIEKATIEQWRLAFEAFNQLKSEKLPTRMIVSTLKGLHVIPIEEIIRMQADGGTTEIFQKNADKRLIASTHLGAYEEQFKPFENFVRVHRGHIVNLLEVVEYLRSNNSLLMSDNYPVPVSRSMREEVIERLSKL